MATLNLKGLLHRKAEFKVKLIAQSHSQNCNIGDLIGIEAIDFSGGYIRCINYNKNLVFELYYDKESWDILGDFKYLKQIKIIKL